MMEKSVLSAWFEWLFTIAGVILFAILNLSLSGMGPIGLAINLLSLLWLFAYFIWPQPQVLLGFFAANALIGPFVFINFGGLGLSTVGRLDYIVAFLICFALFLRSGRLDRYLVYFICMYIILLCWGWMLQYESNSNYLDFFNAWYTTAARIAVGIVLLKLVATIKKDPECGSRLVSRWCALILVTLFVFHIALSYVQLLVPIALRAGTAEAGLNLLGFAINRPTGLLEASYIYGVVTISLWWIWHCIAGHRAFRFSTLLLVSALPVCLISTRSVMLGIALFITLIWWSSAKGVKRSLMTFIVIVVLAVSPLGLLPILGVVDQSNSTKILLAWQVISTWIADFPSLKSLLGYGFDQASFLATRSEFFILAESLGSAYDNRIDAGAGFPIHNVYLQLFFEYGLIAFMVQVWLLWRGLRNILRSRVDTPTIFFWSISVTHYAMHNGIFSPLLILPMILVAFPERLGITRHPRACSNCLSIGSK